MGLDAPGVEVFMLPPQSIRIKVLLVFLVTVEFLISGIATASIHSRTQQRLMVAQQSSRPHAVGLEVLSSTGAVEFNPYLQALYASVRRIFLANIPESAAGGKKGVVVVRFQIQKDGALPDKSATIVARSENKDMNEAALNAIRRAAPFGRLPEGYTGTNLDLQFSFYFNSGPPGPVEKSKQKPKFVPIAICPISKRLGLSPL